MMVLTSCTRYGYDLPMMVSLILLLAVLVPLVFVTVGLLNVDYGDKGGL